MKLGDCAAHYVRRPHCRGLPAALTGKDALGFSNHRLGGLCLAPVFVRVLFGEVIAARRQSP
jgi:hypothetical protein